MSNSSSVGLSFEAALFPWRPWLTSITSRGKQLKLLRCPWTRTAVSLMGCLLLMQAGRSPIGAPPVWACSFRTLQGRYSCTRGYFWPVSYYAARDCVSLGQHKLPGLLGVCPVAENHISVEIPAAYRGRSNLLLQPRSSPFMWMPNANTRPRPMREKLVC